VHNIIKHARKKAIKKRQAMPAEALADTLEGGEASSTARADPGARVGAGGVFGAGHGGTGAGASHGADAGGIAGGFAATGAGADTSGLSELFNGLDLNIDRNPTDSDIETRMHPVACEEISLTELLAAAAPDKPPGQRPKLSQADKDRLISVVKRNWETRHMSLVELQLEAGLSHVSPSTVLKALNERGIKSYREEWKFILKPEDKVNRLKYCQARQHWAPDKEWANYGFTDEMSIEVGGTFGVSLVWRGSDEQYHEDCRGAKKKRGKTVMVWGMIGWGYKVCSQPLYPTN
jgi:hypothetical protein